MSCYACFLSTVVTPPTEEGSGSHQRKDSRKKLGLVELQTPETGAQSCKCHVKRASFTESGQNTGYPLKDSGPSVRRTMVFTKVQPLKSPWH